MLFSFERFSAVWGYGLLTIRSSNVFTRHRNQLWSERTLFRVVFTLDFSTTWIISNGFGLRNVRDRFLSLRLNLFTWKMSLRSQWPVSGTLSQWTSLESSSSTALHFSCYYGCPKEEGIVYWVIRASRVERSNTCLASLDENVHRRSIENLSNALKVYLLSAQRVDSMCRWRRIRWNSILYSEFIDTTITFSIWDRFETAKTFQQLQK